MNRGLLILIIALSMSAPLDNTAECCTSFYLPGKHLMGKSYDWHTSDGLLLVNRRGLTKRALLLRPGQMPALRWTSRYGSVTFNQYGREMPNGGINEKGLAVEVLWLTKTDYGTSNPARPALNELQFVQFLLDTTSSIKELEQQVRRVQIAKAYALVHWFACDASGSCATIEFLNGKLKLHRKTALVTPVLTNNTYQRSLRFLQRFRGFGGTRPEPTGMSSQARFSRTALQLRTKYGGSALDRAFALLAGVQQGSYSKWQIVYDLKKRRIYYRQPGTSRQLTVNLAQLDFRCSSSARVMDLNGTIDSKLHWRWADWNTNLNRKLVDTTFRRLPVRFPPQVLARLINYSTTHTRCR